MTIVALLEQMASNAHHRFQISELTNTLPSEIQNAFLANDSSRLKRQLSDSKNLADRTHVFQINP